jgi:isopenicillin-N N-acyltransferase like protein
MSLRYPPSKTSVLSMIVIIHLASCLQVNACTLFGAIGSSLDGAGVLIGKTRDRTESLEQVFIEVTPKGGYPYRGISTKGKNVVTSGINEKGLVVVSAAASNFKKEGSVTTVGKILSGAASVDGVIEMIKKGQIRGPINYLVGDRKRIALVEVIDGRRNAFLSRDDGTLCHTNHFILNGMKALNPKIGVSSRTRLNRIEELLSDRPLTKEKFIAFTKDHVNGPGGRSICRHVEAGSRSSERTLSTAVFYLPGDGPPELWVALDQPCRSTFERR